MMFVVLRMDYKKPPWRPGNWNSPLCDAFVNSAHLSKQQHLPSAGRNYEYYGQYDHTHGILINQTNYDGRLGGIPELNAPWLLTSEPRLQQLIMSQLI